MTNIRRPDAPSRVIVMGVSGSGKSSIGVLLAKALGLPFKDADDLHPQANKDKMASGIPLTDEDRWPWLDLVGCTLSLPGGGVIACSALRRSYRDRIRKLAPGTVFIHLTGSRELLSERLGNRKDHFMPLSLLESQIATLEPLQSDEHGAAFSVDSSTEEITAGVLSWLDFQHTSA